MHHRWIRVGKRLINTQYITDVDLKSKIIFTNTFETHVGHGEPYYRYFSFTEKDCDVYNYFKYCDIDFE